MPSPRVVLFLDYQNVFRGAQACFCGPFASHWEGQVDPLRLGELIVSRGLPGRELGQVRIYRGQPDSDKDPKGYGANRRQCDAWAQMPNVRVFTRTLRYPPDWPKVKPEEKGIDVALAVDFVTMAVSREYDIGVLMSTDTDLKPALEAVAALKSDPYPRCEVAAWSAGPARHSRRLSIAGSRLWCHWLDKAAYEAVADQTDYTQP